jgi:hypothetical protein
MNKDRKLKVGDIEEIVVKIKFDASIRHMVGSSVMFAEIGLAPNQTVMVEAAKTDKGWESTLAYPSIVLRETNRHES